MGVSAASSTAMPARAATSPTTSQRELLGIAADVLHGRVGRRRLGALHQHLDACLPPGLQVASKPGGMTMAALASLVISQRSRSA